MASLSKRKVHTDRTTVYPSGGRETNPLFPKTVSLPNIPLLPVLPHLCLLKVVSATFLLPKIWRHVFNHKILSSKTIKSGLVQALKFHFFSIYAITVCEKYLKHFWLFSDPLKGLHFITLSVVKIKKIAVSYCQPTSEIAGVNVIVLG